MHSIKFLSGLCHGHWIIQYTYIIDKQIHTNTYTELYTKN